MTSHTISPVSAEDAEMMVYPARRTSSQARSLSGVSEAITTYLPMPDCILESPEAVRTPENPADLETHSDAPEVVRCPHVCKDCIQEYQPFARNGIGREDAGINRSSSIRLRSTAGEIWRFRYLFLLGASIVAIITGVAIWFGTRPVKGLYASGPVIALDHGNMAQQVDLWFQHASGDIRQAFYDGNRWSGGTGADNVLSRFAPRPRGRSPLMAVSYNTTIEVTVSLQATLRVHPAKSGQKRVFYIDEHHNLQESIWSSEGDGWIPGTLGLGNFKASPSPNTGLTVCKSMVWANDPFSLALIYGDADGTNHMLTHNANDTTWQYNHTFASSDASSGAECTIRGASRLDVWMFNTENELEQRSFESNLTSTNQAYPAGQWTKNVTYTGDIRSPTSISGIKYYETNSTYLHFQDSTGYIQEIVVDTGLPTPVHAHPPNTVGTAPAVAGAKLASLDLETSLGGVDSKIFAALDGNSHQLTELSRNFEDNPDWAEVASPVIGA